MSACIRSGIALSCSIVTFLAALLLVAGVPDSAIGETTDGRKGFLALGLRSSAQGVRPAMVEIVDAVGSRVGFGVITAPGEVLSSEHIDVNASGLLLRDSQSNDHAFTVRARDRNHRLVLLAVPTLPAHLPTVDFAAAAAQLDAQPVQRGNIVAAVGRASRPLAAGMVSAVDRTISGKERFEPVPIRGFRPGVGGPRRTPLTYQPLVIQHDSLLTIADLGSALVSVDGRVLGLNVANVLHGIAYAVPARQIAESLELLRTGLDIQGKSRGFLGVSTQPAPVSLLEMLRVPGAVLVSQVMRGYAGERAGIRPGDVLIAIDGQNLLDYGDLVQLVSARRPGESATFRIARDGEFLELLVQIGTTAWKD